MKPDENRSLHKSDLHQLADQLLLDDRKGIEECIQFFEANTKGNWHGRARAMMARRFKHCSLDPNQRLRLVRSVIERFLAGDISEQFRDQLRLALHLDPSRLYRAALARRADSRPYVRRFADWILAHERVIAD
ncbi:MAG TPA: hypothetical protein VGO90_01410 [Chthoniobacteraceae bacterium]|jgi:hypothetical protein|nr:hypothetical protein [Chthoniobacteraceae bacterium]